LKRETIEARHDENHQLRRITMATPKNYLRLSGTVFAIVAVAHLVRAIAQWPIVIGPWNVPVALSWIAAIPAASLSIWAFSLAAADRNRFR
jgi:hypothetical protein